MIVAFEVGTTATPSARKAYSLRTRSSTIHITVFKISQHSSALISVRWIAFLLFIYLLSVFINFLVCLVLYFLSSFGCLFFFFFLSWHSRRNGFFWYRNFTLNTSVAESLVEQLDSWICFVVRSNTSRVIPEYCDKLHHFLCENADDGKI